MTKRALPFLLCLTLPSLGGCPDSGSGPDARLRDDGGAIDAAPPTVDGPTAIDGGVDATAAVTINTCDPALLDDLTGMANVTVTWGFNPTPRCFKMSMNSTLTFNGDFTFHPLVGGTANGNPAVKMPDPASPIAATSSGNTVTFTMASAGTFGFYCDLHTTAIRGAVVVE